MKAHKTAIARPIERTLGRSSANQFELLFRQAMADIASQWQVNPKPMISERMNNNRSIRAICAKAGTR